MIWALKSEIAAALGPVNSDVVLRAVHVLTASRLETGPWSAVLNLQSSLCNLVEGPPEPADAEPL